MAPRSLQMPLRAAPPASTAGPIRFVSRPSPSRSHLFARLRTDNLFLHFGACQVLAGLLSINVRTAAVLTLAVLALVIPASAHAAPTLGATLVKSSVRYGASHTVQGTLIDGTVALGAQEVV